MNGNNHMQLGSKTIMLTRLLIIVKVCCNRLLQEIIKSNRHNRFKAIF
jgi:hypothetical protein